MRKRFCGLLILLLFSASSLIGQSTAPPPPAADCAKFVQQFYDWYLAKEKALMGENSEGSVFEKTLSEKASSFSPDLLKALQEDLAASKKSPDEIVGLDFDPFLDAQDTAEKYVVGEVHQQGDRYRVDVFGFWEGKKNPKPDVVPELAFQNGNWVFMNFHYRESDIPVNENLLSVLQQLKKDREKPAESEAK